MSNINTVIVTGNLTRDTELRGHTKHVSALCGSIAVNDRVKINDEWQDYTNYFEFVMFGKRAESLQRYMLKGQRVALRGKLRWQKWEQDGETRTKVSIIVDDVDLLGSKQSNDQKTNSECIEDVQLPF